MCGKDLQIYDVYIPRKCIEFSTHSHRQHFFQKSVSPTAEKGGAKYDLLYQNSIKKMKMPWYIRLFIFCMICNFFKCHGFTVLQIISII